MTSDDWRPLIDKWVDILGIRANRIRVVPVVASQYEYEFSSRLDPVSQCFDIYVAVDRPVDMDEAEEAVVHELIHWVLAPLDVAAAQVIQSDAFPEKLHELLSDEWEREIESIVWVLTSWIFDKPASRGELSVDVLLGAVRRLVDRIINVVSEIHGPGGGIVGEVLRIKLEETEAALVELLERLNDWRK
jgi:hypothetical protein